MLPKLFFWLALVVGLVSGVPMSYKKIDQEKYELDLVPISSTVIPLHEIKVEAGTHPKILTQTEIRRLLKKHKVSEDDPHELITGKLSFLKVKSKNSNAWENANDLDRINIHLLTFVKGDCLELVSKNKNLTNFYFSLCEFIAE